jgi:N-acyl amino acid synthase of PEP-CTERM/exosortase system
MDAKRPAAPLPEQTEESLLDKFNTYFEVIPALAQDEIQQALRIRYQVYCVENPFENAADHPDGLERDEFDFHSLHSLLIHRASGQAMGTTRLIMPVHGRLDRSFAIQHVCEHPMLRRLPLHRTAEVSRFSISKEFRRRKNDTLYEGRDAPGGQRCPAPLMSLGLIQSLVRMSADYGITHWCATMEPKLLRLLVAMGIRFEPLGPLVEYHGTRQPCYCEVAPMLLRVKIEQRALWEILTDGGPLLRRPLFAA